MSEGASRRLRAGAWAALALIALGGVIFVLAGSDAAKAERERARDAGLLAAFVNGERDARPPVARLEQQVRHAPRDGRAWVLLARRYAERDDFAAAAAAYEQALAVSPRVARDPLVWCEFADAVGMAQGGSLRGRPRELIQTALALDARHPRALEMAGSAAYEAGDFGRALGHWQTLLAQLEPGSPEQVELGAAVARLQDPRLASVQGNAVPARALRR